MKTFIVILAGVLFIGTLSLKADPSDNTANSKNVHHQIQNILTYSDISESGYATVYFYVYNNRVIVQNVLGTNSFLNVQVKQLLEKTLFRKNVLNGYYMINIKMNIPGR